MYLTDEQANDKDLISELASQSIQKPVFSLERLSGEMAYNYTVNHHYIFKLPSEKTNPDDWLRQSQYMPILQNKFSFQIPIPSTKPVYLKKQNASFVSSSYKKIDGHCIENTFLFSQKDIKFKVRFFEQLSNAANQIHNISQNELPLELPTKPDILERYFFQKLRFHPTYYQKKFFRKLAHNPLLGLGNMYDKTSVLTHSDLHCGNVVLDDKDNLIGLLDFDTFGRGDYAWEFRPLLYADPNDISLFKKIYTQKTGTQIKSNDTEKINQFKSTLKWLYALYTLGHCLPPKKQKQFLKHEIDRRKKIKSIRSKQID